MGNTWVQQHFTMKDSTPVMDGEVQFDPLFGFPNGRKERVMEVSELEMRSLRLEKNRRDYCAHTLINLMTCNAIHWPWTVPCDDVKHVHDECQFQDWVLRMKEFEREKRMLRRAKRVPIENAGWKQIAVE